MRGGRDGAPGGGVSARAPWSIWLRAREPRAALAWVPLVVAVTAVAAIVPARAGRESGTAAATQVSAGLISTCALTTDGAVKCWGANIAGELGNGTSTSSSTPVAVGGLSSASSISSGGYHTCALVSGGAVQCWGYNRTGQLGDGSTKSSSSPVTVTGLPPVVAVSAGFLHTCALTSTGDTWCWGFDFDGQLGDGRVGTGSVTPVDSTVPVQVQGTPAGGFVQIAAGGFFSCGRTSGGAVWCWGSNSNGQLGDNDPNTALSTTPVQVIGLAAPVASLVAGQYHACALLTTAIVQCWGDGGGGRLGDGSGDGQDAPITVQGLSGVLVIAADVDDTCAVMGDRSVRCWGLNTMGELGTARSVMGFALTPVAVPGLPSTASLALGGHHGCALGTDTTLWCWGSNLYGEVGNGSTQSPVVPAAQVRYSDDLAAPTVTLAITGPNGGTPDGHAGWFVTGPVLGSVTADDSSTGGSIITSLSCTGVSLGSTSGVDAAATASGTFSISADGVTQVSCTATDAAGNTSAPAATTVQLDVNAPAVTWTPDADVCATPSSQPGWCLGQQTASFNATDGGSGLDLSSNAALSGCASTSSCAFGMSTGTNGSAVTIPSGQVCDVAGNCSSVTAGPYAIDSVAPTLAPSISPSPILLNGPATANPGATDALQDAFASGIASATCGPIGTSATGQGTITCQAADVAGNTVSQNVYYLVQYAVGIASPIKNSTITGGTKVNIAVGLKDANGALISDSEATSLASACRVTISATGAQPLSGKCMKYNTTQHRFVYQWTTTSTQTGVDKLTAAVSYPGTTTKTILSEKVTIS